MSESIKAAFAEPNPTDAFEKRLFTIGANIRVQEEVVSILTDKARAKMRAVTSVFKDIDIAQPNALGRIGLLERTLGLNEQATRTTRRSEGTKIVMGFMETEFEPRVIGILSRLNELAGFINYNKQLEIMSRLRELDPKAVNLAARVSEIEGQLKIDPNAKPAQTTERDVIKSSSLLEAFAPRDKVSSLSLRRAALEERLKKIAEASDVLTDEARATMNEAVKYLGTIDVNGEAAEGRIGLLEDALNVHPQVYRDSASKGSSGSTREG